ncbi:MAG: flagellar assembly peptidoglycan hydrolase FlgJ [Burkholderiales bacterium]
MTSARAPIDARLALDARGLDRLKMQLRERPDEALKTAAKQFEAVFMNTLLKSMRDALPNSDPLASSDSKMYRGMLDQELVGRLAERGIGIADVLVRQVNAAQRGRRPEGAGPSAAQALEKLTEATNRAKPAGTTGAPESFVQKMIPEARAAERNTGVPAEFILGQAALESGWGQREIRRQDGSSAFNLFGIKAGSNWKGATVDATTTEHTDGVARKVVEKFRAYSSYAESFQDYAKLIASNPRYAEAVKRADSAADFAKGLQQGGYATDPRYAEKLTRVINHTIAITRTGSRSV